MGHPARRTETHLRRDHRPNALHRHHRHGRIPLRLQKRPQEAIDAVDGGINLVGNLNNPVTLYSKGPEEVRAEVFKALDAGVQLIAPECAIPLKTKLENLLEIPRAVEDWAAEHWDYSEN